MFANSILSFDQARPFTPFGFSHWVILVLAIAAFIFGRYLGKIERIAWGKVEKYISYMIIIFFPIHFLVYFFVLKTFSVRWDLPFLQICGVSALAIVGSLLTKTRIFQVVAYFWGFGAMFASFLTPALSEDFPHIYYYLFWGSHLILMLVLGLLVSRRPVLPLRYREVWQAFGVLAVYISFIYPFNHATGGNYAFVREIPSGNAFGQIFGNFWSQPPYYLLPASLVIIVLFHIEYFIPLATKVIQSKKEL